MALIRPGRYRHYKGNDYAVLGVARHSETLEELVVYRQEYGERGLWVRPAAMFTEMVEIAGQSVPRFRAVDRPVGSRWLGWVRAICARGGSEDRKPHAPPAA